MARKETGNLHKEFWNMGIKVVWRTKILIGSTDSDAQSVFPDAIPAPDCIVPVDSAFPVFTYAPGNQSAGIAYKGNYRTFVLGFPFESILSEADRAIVMAGILGFFTQK